MRYLLILLTLIWFNPLNAQWNWPVQVNAFTTGPFYNYLAYYGDQNDHLQIQVTLTDQNATTVPAQLKLRIEGPGWWVETDPNKTFSPIYLTPFVPEIISGPVLLPYLNESNLLKSDPNLDLNNLPEGVTEICVEVIGIGGTLTISGNQCSSFWLQRFQPPQAFTPQCGAQLDTNSMFHTFQWTTPIGYAPFIGTDIQYTFSLYEWTDPNNFTIFQTGQGLVYQTVVTNDEQLVLNDFDVQLQNGMDYVWRVQAQIIDNGIPIQMIENNGLSEICTFTYGEAVSLEETLVEGLVIDLDALANTQYKGTATWTVTDNTPGTGLSTYERYFIEYRLAPDAQHPNPTWHYDTVYALNKLMYQLAPESTYEVRVSGMAGSYTSDPTPIVSFTTPAEAEYACGDQQIPFRPSQFTPNENVRMGDWVQIGQFRMKITEATPKSQAGYYSGKGKVPIDFLAGARAKVTFDNILIDQEYVVREGRVDITTDGVDAWLHEQLKQFVDPIYVTGTIDSAWVDTTAGTAWVVVDGQSISFQFDPPDYPIVIHDDSGMAWTIYPNGTITVEGYLNPSNDHLDVSADSAAVFAQNNNEIFGFDAKEHMAWHENYEIIELPDSSYYFVPNKSIGRDETDVVDVEIPFSGTPTFKLDDQTNLTYSPFGSTPNTYTVNIPAISSQGKKEVYVYNGNQRIGKLNLHVYKKKERDVVIVPIANTSVDATLLKAKLDETLKEANLDVAVTVESQWNNSTFTPTTTLALPDNLTLMTDYSQDMRDLRDAYFADPGNQKVNGAYYLFVIPGFDDPSNLGYMVQGKALGFVKGDDYSVYAHELAHGMGGLHHSWQFGGPDQGSSQNLMDYTPVENVNLTLEQWRELRDFDLAPGMFDEVEDYLSVLETAKFDYDSIQVQNNNSSTDPLNVDVPISNFDQDAVFRAPNALFFRINPSVRQSIDYIRFTNGFVTDLIKDTVESTFAGFAYYTTGDQNNEKVTSEILTVAFLNKYAPRNITTADKDGSDIILCDGAVPGDFYDLDFPQCHEFNGEYVRGWANNQPVTGNINCPEEDECESIALKFFSDNQKNKVKDAFTSIIQKAISSPGDYNPFRFIDGPNLTLDKKDKLVIKDKIQVLNDYRNNTIVGYIGMNGVNKYLFTQETCDSMAQVVMNEVAPQFPGKKLVLYFNHQISGINQTIVSTTGWSCQTSSFATNAPDIIETGTLPQDLSSFSDAANSFFYLFSKIKKPYYITTIYEKYDGSFTWKVINKMDDPSEDIFGLPFIFGANHVVSKYKERYDHWHREQEIIVFSLLSAQAQSAVQSMFNMNLTIDTSFIHCTDSLNAIIALAESNQRLDYPGDWLTGDITFGQVKESCLNAKIALMEYKKLSGDSEFWVDLQLVSGANYGGFSSAIYYEFDSFEKVIDPIVYGALDVLGCIPGVDILTDAAGMIYATVRGDAASASIYAAALAIPFLNALELKASKKAFNVYAKIGANDALEYAIKSTDEVTTGWTKISNDIPYTNNRKSVIKTELESSVSQFDDNIIRQIVNVSTAGNVSGFKKLASSISTSLPTNAKQALDGHIANQTFIPFDNLPHVMQTPSTFINETGSDMYDMVIDNNLYMKYDANDGRIMLCDANDGTYHAFVQEAVPWTPPTGANTNQAIQQHMTQQADKLKNMLGMSGESSVTIQGNLYSLSQTKTSSFLGRLSDIEVVLSELGNFKNVDLGEVPGGKNLLNRPEIMFSSGYADWWQNHNKPWILRIIERNDDIYLASDPNNILNLLSVQHQGVDVPTITAYELRELKIAGKRPVNITINQWDNIKDFLDNMENAGKFIM